MGMDYWKCWHSYAAKLARLSDEEVGRLFRALMVFSETGERVGLNGIESIAFDFIACDIERAQEAYEDKCRKNAENVSKRYRSTDNDGIPTPTESTTVYDRIRTLPSKDKGKDKGKGKVKEKESIGRFTPPTLAQVRDYCLERGNGVDPERFCDYYTSNGWMVGKNKMKDWQAAVRSWERKTQTTTSQPKSFADLWREMDE